MAKNTGQKTTMVAKDRGIKGKIINVSTAKRSMPRKRDTNIPLPNQTDRAKELLTRDIEPKRLIGQTESKVDEAIEKYFAKKNTTALQGLLQNYMYFPRNLVKKAEGYLQILINSQNINSGFTESELKLMDVSNLLSVGSKIGLFFPHDKLKEDMIKAIIDMQTLSLKRKQV